jgi:hypothetical protein
MRFARADDVVRLGIAADVALLVAMPPLLLWLVWLVGTSRTNNADSSAAKPVRLQELYSTDSRTEFIESSPSKRPVREES